MAESATEILAITGRYEMGSDELMEAMYLQDEVRRRVDELQGPLAMDVQENMPEALGSTTS